MLLKKAPAYRKAEKEDFSMIREFIRRNYKDRWEFEETHTEKRLTRLFFYTYMIYRDSVTVATYRDQVVGVLITGKESHGHFAPVFRLKKGYHFLRRKFTKEGRKNLEHFNKLQDMKKQLTVSPEKPTPGNILFLYVSKDYRRNGIGTGLLKQISTEKDTDYSINYAGDKWKMKKIGIMADSHSGILKQEAEELDIHVLPMPFYLNGELFHEDLDFSRTGFYEKLREGADVSTSQPSPQEVMEMWDEMLLSYDQILYIPLSSSLSGSCMTAAALSQEPKYENKVFVVDNGRVSTPLHRSILDAIDLVEDGYTAPQIKDILEASREKTVIYVGLSTLEYLKKGGRINTTTALAANLLNIKPVMKFGTGKLDVFQKCRGMKKSRKAMIDAMHRELETTFKKEYDAGKVYLMAASSSTAEVTADWISQIRESFPGMDVMCDDLSLGLSCHIGPDGLGIGCSCIPL